MTNKQLDKHDLTCGKAILMVTNSHGEIYRFLIEKPKPEMPFFVRMLAYPGARGRGRDKRTYLGVYRAVRLPGTRYVSPLALTAKSKYENGTEPVDVFNWAVDVICGIEEQGNGIKLNIIT